MDRPPTREILQAIKKLNNWRSGGDAKIPAEFFKALCKGFGREDTTENTKACVAVLVSMYQKLWTTGSYPGEADISRRIRDEVKRTKSIAFRIGKTLRGKGWHFRW
jgi:hypothetical protein